MMSDKAFHAPRRAPQAPTEGVQTPLGIALNGLSGLPRGCRRYCRRQHLFLANHASLARPAQQPTNLFSTFAAPWDPRTCICPFTCRSRLRGGSVQRCLCSVFAILDAMPTSIAHAESATALHYSRGPAVTPLMRRSFDEGPHSAYPMSRFAPCDFW